MGTGLEFIVVLSYIMYDLQKCIVVSVMSSLLMHGSKIGVNEMRGRWRGNKRLLRRNRGLTYRRWCNGK